MDYPTGDNQPEEKLDRYNSPEGIVIRWLREIDLVEESKEQRKFEKDGERIVKRYKNASQATDSDELSVGKVMFNILWANVQVLAPTLFCRMPKAVVERMHKDADPVGRVGCTIAERCVSYNLSVQEDRFMIAVGGAVLDRLLPGKGGMWIRYDAEFEDMRDEYGEPVIDEDGTPIREAIPNTERAIPDPVVWKDLLHSSARNRYEIRWIARKCYMTKDELTKAFGKDIACQCEMSLNPGKRTKNDEDSAQFLAQAEVYEIWDKTSKKVYKICKGLKTQPLQVLDDPLKLDGFFPCPGFLSATTTTDSTYPTPDFKIYERLADELDYTTKRISSMTESVRLVGLVAAQFEAEFKNMLDLDDGQLKSVKNFQAFAEKGGIEGAVYWWPFDKAAAAIPILSARAAELLQTIYNLIGIADIVRGASDPSETLGAQQMKGKATSVRTAISQADVQRFCREAVRIMAQIIFEPGLFADETIALMSNYEQMSPEDQELFMPALEMLRNDRMQTFRVGIEIDSTISVDEDQNQERWMKYMQTVQAMASELQSVVSFRPELLHPMIESAKGAIRSMRAGRTVEGAWDKAWTEIEKNDAAAKAQPPPPPPPDPNMLRAEAEMTKAQNQAQYDQGRLGIESQKVNMDFEIRSKELEVEMMKNGNTQYIEQMDLELKQFAQRFTTQLESARLDLAKGDAAREDYRVVLDEQEKLLEEKRLAAKERTEAVAEQRKEGGKSPPVNINLSTDQPVNFSRPKRAMKHRMRQNPTTGDLEAESMEIPHPDEMITPAGTIGS